LHLHPTAREDDNDSHTAAASAAAAADDDETLTAEDEDLIGQLGRAVQVDPVKPKFKPPGAERLKLKCDTLPSN
jgi:hypothetical protein